MIDQSSSERAGLTKKVLCETGPNGGLFTQAFGLVTLSTDERRYKQGVTLMWRTIDECIDGKVDRTSFGLPAVFRRGPERR